MKEVNYIKQLTEAMSKMSDDDRLNPSHVSLYIALFQFWNMNRFKSPISVNRSDVMRVSKIGSNATYHRCITDLHKWKYLEYLPSYNPFKGSKVNMFIFGTGSEQVVKVNRSKNEQVSEQAVNRNHSKSEQVSEQVVNRNHSKNEQVPEQVVNRNHSKNEQVPEQVVNRNHLITEQALVPSINSIKLNKQYKHYKQIKTKEGEEKNSSPHPSQNKNIEFSCKGDLQSPKKASRDELNSSDTSDTSKKTGKDDLQSSDTPKKTSPTKRKRFIPPNLKEVKTFFHENKSSYQVAETFFNHFESNGWLVGGRAKMKNWKAAARNWITRDEKYQAQNRSPAQQRLHVNENKDYSEPL